MKLYHWTLVYINNKLQHSNIESDSLYTKLINLHFVDLRDNGN